MRRDSRIVGDVGDVGTRGRRDRTRRGTFRAGKSYVSLVVARLVCLGPRHAGRDATSPTTLRLTAPSARCRAAPPSCASRPSARPQRGPSVPRARRARQAVGVHQPHDHVARRRRRRASLAPTRRARRRRPRASSPPSEVTAVDRHAPHWPIVAIPPDRRRAVFSDSAPRTRSAFETHRPQSSQRLPGRASHARHRLAGFLFSRRLGVFHAVSPPPPSSIPESTRTNRHPTKGTAQHAHRSAWFDA